MTDPGGHGAANPAEQLRARMRVIAEQAHKNNVARAEQLGAAIERLSVGELADDAQAEAAEVAHKLAGSSGTFGYLRVSDYARRIEQLLRHEPPDPGELAPLLGDLALALAGPPDEPVD